MKVFCALSVEDEELECSDTQATDRIVEVVGVSETFAESSELTSEP